MQTIEKKSEKTFLNYINIFRGLAILLIIAGHSMQFGSAVAHKINCEIVCGGTALFIFISGFLFQHLSYKFEYKNYLSKKLTNVIMPYIITAIPGLFFCFYFPVAYKNTFYGTDWYIQIPMLLSIGRVHNTPTWFIPMIILFFLCSIILLKLEKKGILYKLLPVLFIITVFLQRGDIEYEGIIALNPGLFEKYMMYVKYIFTGFVHFFSLYVFGMYCSANKDIIDKFYEKRFMIFIAMILSAVFDIYLADKNIYCNYTVSKTFLTMLVLGYLKHYDEYITAHEVIRKPLDLLAKYSFGLFFVHWYLIFVYNKIFHINGVIPLTENNPITVILLVLIRFIAVTGLSFIALFVFKSILQKLKLNTRMFSGI